MKVEQKYQKLTDIEHCLLRPGMWIGSTKTQLSDSWILTDNIFIKREISYTPAFIKIFDEIISNSADEHRCNPKLDTIKVEVDISSGRISVWDNGGIPVVMHSDHNQWIPEMIFSSLKAGSNFNDANGRKGSGLHGVGSTLTNIFSKTFIVETCDRVNTYVQVFEDNMKKVGEPKIKKGGKPHTKITFNPDLARFNMTEIDGTTIDLLKTRAIHLAAANPNLKIWFNGILYHYPKFLEYCKLYTGDSQLFFEESKNWSIGFNISNSGFQAISFVNSVETKDGGTHVDYIVNQLIQYLREMIKKKHRVDVKPSELKQHLSVYINCTINNPSFNSQTKEKMITEVKDFGNKHELSEKIAKDIFKSEIIQSVLDWIEKKALAQERAELRKLNKDLDKTKIPKLIDAQKKGDRGTCILGIYEGLSAVSAVRKFRDTQIIGAFPLKGKFINISEMKSSDIIKNDEAIQLMASLGLKLGEEPKGLRYGRIYIYTDADPDGSHIAATLINFFDRFWPELFDQGRIYKVMTPLVVAKKGKESLNFYTNDEFDKWVKKNKTSAWNIEYKKGLGALEDAEYEEIIRNPYLVQIKNDKDYKDSLESWFGKDSQPRKDRILENNKR